MNRKSWLQTGMISGGLALRGGYSNVHSPMQASPFQFENPALGGGDFKLGAVTYNLAKDWDLATILKNCSQAKFEAIELRTTHRHGVEPSISRERRQEVRDQFLDAPVRLLSLGSTCEFHSPDAAVVQKNIEETKRFVELAHDIGAIGVKVRPNGIPQGVAEQKTLEQIGRALRQCGQQAQGYGIEIWLEVHGKDSCLPQRIRKMMEFADHPMVGICWNSNAEDVENGSVKSNFQLLKPWLRNVHINELWQEAYPWRELFALLKAAEYNRYTLAEIEGTTDADSVRFMRYYRALWWELTR